jgi:hypothetical protein
MKFDKPSSSFDLLKLALSTAKFNLRQVLTTLLLILLFATGSWYIAQQIYKHKLFATAKTKPAGKTQAEKPKAPKKPASVSKFDVLPKSFSVPIEVKLKRRRKDVARLKSQLMASELNHPKKHNRIYRKLLDKEADEKLNRHQSILDSADEMAKLKLQDQHLDSEEDLGPFPPEEEDLPPPSKKKSGFWDELGRDIFIELKELARKFL